MRQKSIRELTNKSFFDRFFLKINESKEGVNVSLSGWIPIGRIPKNKRSREIVMKVDPWAFIDPMHSVQCTPHEQFKSPNNDNDNDWLD